MNKPPDDPDDYNSPTENALWTQLQSQAPNYPQPGSTPAYQPAYPPNLGPIGQPGFTPPPQSSPQQGAFPNYPGQPPTWQPPQAPGAYPNQPYSQPPQTPSVYPGQSPQGFPPPPPQQQGQYGAPPSWPNMAQPPGTPKKSNKGLIIVSIVIVCLLAVGGTSAFLIIHSKNSNTPATATTTVQSSPTTNGTTPFPTQPAGNITPIPGIVGQPIQAGGNWIATVTRTHETTASTIPPSPGNTYLEISISLKNVSATPQVVSSLLQFTLVDSRGQTYSELKAVGDSNIHQTVDGNVTPGQTLNGQIPYQVPLSAHTFILTFKYGITSGSNASVSWTLNV